MPDEQGRPTDAFELNQQLASTIGAQVEALLGMTNGVEANNMMIEQAISAGRQPAGGGEAPPERPNSGLPAGQGSAPVTTQQPPTPAPAQEGMIDWESTKAANGLYLGKYKTQADAVRGVAHTVAMAKTAFSRADEVAAENARLRSEMEALRTRPVAAPASVPQSSPAPAPSRGTEEAPNEVLNSVLLKLQEGESLTAEDLMNALRADRESTLEQARKVAREELTAKDAAERAQAQRWAKVEEYMSTKYPDSVHFTSELELFVKSHPLIGAGVQALIAQDRHEEATGYAWEAMVAAQGLPQSAPFVPAPATKENVEREIRLDAADQVRREAVDEARRDAGIIGSGAGARGVHENANIGPTQEEYDEAVALMRQGDGTKWRALAFRDTLNHPIFG